MPYVQALAAYYLTLYYGLARNWEKLGYYQKQIAALLAQYDSADIALQQAQVACNLTLYYHQIGELAKAEQCYGEIIALVNQYPTPEMAYVQAQAAYDLARLDQLEQAEYYYQQIVNLQEQFATPEIACAQYKLAKHLESKFRHLGNSEKEDYYFRQMIQIDKIDVSEWSPEKLLPSDAWHYFLKDS